MDEWTIIILLCVLALVFKGIAWSGRPRRPEIDPLDEPYGDWPGPRQ